MQRQGTSRNLSGYPGPGVLEESQGELFSVEALRDSGKPVRIKISDPNHPHRHRILVVASRVMLDLIGRIQRVASTNAIVLLLGESGTGKNLLAWLIHQMSVRNSGPFVHFSAGQKSEQLIESELFGHERGAFTGAHEARRGKIELAKGGTIFVDEIAELGATGQLKFHRLLDDGTYDRVGGTEERLADVRVVAATHRDLGGMTREGKFREDLYHRINVVCLRVPPLRERPEDIAPIAQEILEDLALRHNKPYLNWSREALNFITQLPWRGNVRAIRNAIESMVVFAKDDTLTLEDLPAEIFFNESPLAATGSLRPMGPRDGAWAREQSLFHEAYRGCRGNKSAISRILRTSRSQVDRLLARFGKPE